MANSFSVLLLTATPPGMSGDHVPAFSKIDGREAVLRSSELFLNRDNVQRVAVVIAPEGYDEAKRKFGGHFGFTGVKMISGGPGWMKQIAAGAQSPGEGTTYVVVHDAARPAVSYADIDALLEASEKHAAVALTAPLRSTLVELDEGGNALAIYPASSYAQLVTPMVFSRERFLKMAESETEPHASELTLVKGSALNVRFSGSSDGGMLKSLISMLPKPKVKPPSSPFEEAQW